jgi:hypothetical protein
MANPCGLSERWRRLSRGPSFLALCLPLLCRFLQSVWLSNRDGCEGAEGGAQNLSLGRKPYSLRRRAIQLSRRLKMRRATRDLKYLRQYTNASAR